MKNLSNFTESSYVRTFSKWEGNFVNDSDVGYPDDDYSDELPSLNYPKTSEISETVED